MHGRAGVEELRTRKPVLERKLRLDPPFASPPYGARTERLTRRFR